MTAVATLPLALEDVVPVVLAGIGAWLLVDAAARDQHVRRAGRLGVVLVLLAGLCKAGWKLVLAASGHDVGVDALLFVLLAPGFTLLCWVLLRERAPDVPVRGALLLPAAAGALSLVVGSIWPLLLVAVLAATATGLLAVALARRRADLPAAWLFAVQVGSAYALVPFAGAEQSVAHQWVEQSLNTVGQGAFALAACRLNALDLVRSTS